jgi:O-antigen ligase
MRDRWSRDGDSSMPSKPVAISVTGANLSASPAGTRPSETSAWLGLPKFEWSLVLLGFCIYTFVVVTYYLRIAEIGLAIGALGLFLQREKLRLPLPFWLFAAFICWAFLASFASPNPSVAHEAVGEGLKLLAIMFIATNALRTEGQLRFYLLFFLGCFILFPVRGVFLGGATVFGRAVWNYIYANPNDLAALCVLALGIALGFTFSQWRAVLRLGAAVSATLLMIVILLTQSRGAFIGLFAGIVPGLVWSGLKRPGRLLVFGTLLAIIIAYTVPPSVWARLSGIAKLTDVSTIVTADAEGSAVQRFAVQRIAWQIFLDHPLFGVGLGAYPIANAEYAPEIGKLDAHNTYLSLAAEVGLPGLLLWCALVGTVLRYAYRNRQMSADGDLPIQQLWLERAVWAYLVTAMFGSYSKQNFLYLMLAVLWCSATLLAARSRTAAAARS